MPVDAPRHPILDVGDPYPLGTRIGEHGHLEVGGCDLTDVAERFGTPCYVFAEDDLQARARAFADAVTAWAPGADVSFAAKALPCRAILELFSSQGLGVNVSSEGELRLALAAGVQPGRVVLHGHANTEEQLGFALHAGVGTLVVDGLDVAERAERAASACGRTWDVLLRVVADVPAARTPRVDARTGQIDLKTGVPIHHGEAAEIVRQLLTSSHLHLRGLHQHYSEALADARLPALARLADLVAETGMFCEVVSVGGGPALGNRADTGAAQAAIDAYIAANARELHRQMTRVGLATPRLAFEPGAALVGRGGVILYRVVGVRRGVRTYAVLDGGTATDPRPLLYGVNQTAALVDRFTDPSDGPVSLAGSSSELGDVLAWDVELPVPRPGDLIVTPNAGAYTFALSSRFDAAPRAPIVVCREGRARAVVRREAWEDLFGADM